MLDSKLWLPVYDLVRVLRVGEDDEGVAKSGGADAPRGNTIVDVVSSAHDRYTVLAVLCSNNAIILRLAGDAGPLLGAGARYPAGALIHVLTFFTDNGLVVSALSLSPAGDELLVATVDGRLYIVAVASLLLPSLVSGDVNQPTAPSIMAFLKAADAGATQGGSAVTHVCNVELTRQRGRDRITLGFVRDAVWWRTQAGGDHAVCACSGGFVSIVDIARRAEVRCLPIPIRPHSLHLCRDSAAESLLITGKRGLNGTPSDQSTCVLLECEVEDSAMRHNITVGADAARVGASAMAPTVPPPPYQPVLLPHLNSSSANTQTWTASLGRGREGVLVYEASILELSCYDASLTPSSVRNPLYVYHVGPDATHVHLTSGAVLYSHVAGGHQKIAVLSRFAAAAHPRNRLRRGVDSGVLQEILLPGERVQGFTAGAGAAAADSDDGLPVEATIVWTEQSVYELAAGARTPTDLFIDTVLYGVDARCHPDGPRLLAHADSLAKAYQLNIIALYERCADACRSAHMRWALQLYKRTDIRPDEYVRRLARYGGQDDLLRNLLGFLRTGNEELNAVLFYTALHCILKMPRSNGIPSTPRFKIQGRSLSRVSLMSFDSDDIASRGTSSVKSAFGRSSLRELSTITGRGGDVPSQRTGRGMVCSTRASAQATASANDTLEVSTSKTNEDDSYMVSAARTDGGGPHDPTPNPAVALSSSMQRVKKGDAESLEMLRTLAESGMVSRAVELAVGCGLVAELLEHLAALSYTRLPAAAIDKLVDGGYAETFISTCPQLVPALPPHSQLMLCLSTISNGDAQFVPRVGLLLMQCAKLSALHRAYGVLKLFSVELCALAVLRLAQLTEGVARRHVGEATQLPYDFAVMDAPPAPQRHGTFDSFDLVVCQILRKCNGEWSPEVVRRYARATERWRVASTAALLARDPETATLWFLMWVHKRFHPLTPGAAWRDEAGGGGAAVPGGRHPPSAGQSPQSIDIDGRSESLLPSHRVPTLVASPTASHAAGGVNKPVDISTLVADFVKGVLRDGGFSAAARRRCLRMVLAFYETARLPPQPLVAALTECGAADDVFAVILATPSYATPLPVPYLLGVAKGCLAAGGDAAVPAGPTGRTTTPTRQRGNSTGKGDGGVGAGGDGGDSVSGKLARAGDRDRTTAGGGGDPDEVKKAIVIAPPLLQRAAKEKERLVVFTCGHPPMPIGKFTARIMDFQSQSCPLAAAALRATADRVQNGMCNVTAQGCPKCVAEAMKIAIPPSSHKDGPATHKAAGAGLCGRPGRKPM